MCSSHDYEHLWRQLEPAEEGRFRRWARDHYLAGQPINPLWHPAVVAECDRMNAEAGAGQRCARCGEPIRHGEEAAEVTAGLATTTPLPSYPLHAECWTDEDQQA